MGGICLRRSSVDSPFHSHRPVDHSRPFKGEAIKRATKSSMLQADFHTVSSESITNHHISVDRTGSLSSSKGTSGLAESQLPFPNAAPLRMRRGLDDMDESSQEYERGDKSKLVRVLSSKAKTARSRTTIAAKKGAAKVNEMGALIGRAGTMGLGKAVEALDTLGSSMTNLNLGSGFASGTAPRGNKIGILAFEVANTIVKGYNLKQSLLVENMRILKEEVLLSEGVQRLISANMSELLSIAATDKRNELKIFSGEVVRFGNHCRDPQWHQLDRMFEKLDADTSVPRQTKEEAEAEMQNLMSLAQHTAELYHELHALDRFEMDYCRKLQEDELFNNSQRGDSLTILKNELKSQKRHVKNLKKRSLWSKILEEVMEKLVDIVYFLHQEINEAFNESGQKIHHKKQYLIGGISERLGPAGLSLHYANIINQIDSLVSRPSSIPPNARDNLYQGLPPAVKSSLRVKIRNSPLEEEVTIPQIKAEMEKTLAWLVPVAVNTTKAHHGFGWVGEWATTGSSLDCRLPGHMELILLQTLHHADKNITENYILELVVWLHHLVSLARSGMPGSRSPIKSPIRSPPQLKANASGTTKFSVEENGHAQPELSPEDQVMLQSVKNKKITPGISKSQEFNTSKANVAYRSNRLSKSNSHSPSTSKEVVESLMSFRRHAAMAPFNFEVDRIRALDVIDRVDNI